MSLAFSRLRSFLATDRRWENTRENPARRDRMFIVGLCFVCAAALLIRWPVADLPLERDEGEYAYIAQRWLRGDVPYRDAFDQKPPGTFVAYAVIESFIGTSPAALHWGAQLYTLATLIVIALIGRRFLNEQAGLLAALFASFMTTDHSVLGNAANTEMFMILPLAGGFLCTVLAVERASAGWALAAGALSCLAMQFKQVALTNAVFNGLLLLMVARRRVRIALAYVMGGILAAMPAIGYFWSVGALADFFDCVIGHNLSYSQRTPMAEYWQNFWGNFGFILSKCWPIYAFAVTGLIYWGRGAVPRRSRLILGGWLTFSFIGVCIGGYFREHYFFQIIPAVAVLAGIGLTLLTNRFCQRASAIVAWCAAALSIGIGVSLGAWYFLPGDPIAKVGYIYGNCPFGESLAVAEYIRDHTAPDETVFILGSEPQILYYAERKSASRYIFVYPLMTPFADTADRQAGVLRELAAARPRIIVVATQGSSYFDDEQTPPLLEKSLGELLRSCYDLAGFVDEGDRRLRPYSGELTDGDVPRPRVAHTLAVWRRRD